MFKLFAFVEFLSKAPRWAAKVPDYQQIFGFSSFGDLFLCSSDGTRFALLRTERPELIELNFRNEAEFKAQLLQEPEVLRSVFRAGDHNALVARLGPPSAEDCFYPVPYPAIGGSGALETYQSGNIWAHLDLYAQVLGV